jgi:hypothetical protein
MTIVDDVDGSGSGLLNAISRDLSGRTKGNNNEGIDHVTPSKLIIKCQVFSVHAIKYCRGSGGITPLILKSVLDGGEMLTSRIGHFTPEKELLIPTE